MKKKIICIFIGTLLITTALSAVGTMNNYKKDLIGIEEKTFANNNVIFHNNIGSPPVITVTDPPFGIIKIVNNPDIHVSGYVTDDLGINGFGYVIEYADGTAMGPFVSVDPPDTYYTFDIHENIKWGPNYLTIEVSDVDGNWATKDVILFYITVKNKAINTQGN